MGVNESLFGNWSTNPDGSYSYSNGVFTGAPPGGTYVPAAIDPATGNIKQGHFDYPPDCTTCQAAKKDQDKNKVSDKVTDQIKTKTSYGDLYTTSTTNLDGSGTSYGFGMQSTPSYGTSTSVCTQYGDGGGITNTVSGSFNGSSYTNSQGLANPFSDAANSSQICTPITPSTSTGVSLGFGGFK
jgi:hypothetical protein